ncbi:hypothetical protein [Undibacterium sp. TC9W]|uniref:hypothetical protein n=1 Tax=Undibacterium sp. TC9W TaxID=3413053 RepID=UPI003BF3EB98
MREFISAVAFILSFASVGGMIFGLISPNKIAEKDKPIPTRKSIFFSFTLVALILSGIGYVVSPSDDTATVSQQDADAAKLQKSHAEVNTNVSASTKAKPVFLNVPMADSEKKFVQDAVCIDDSACYGNKSFERDIYKEFPELKVLHPRIKEASRTDSAGFKNQFHEILRGLYFAKKNETG